VYDLHNGIMISLNLKVIKIRCGDWRKGKNRDGCNENVIRERKKIKPEGNGL